MGGDLFGGAVDGVFVTGGLAVPFALELHDLFVCGCAGRVPSAKSFGPLPMHHLHRQRTQTGV